MMVPRAPGRSASGMPHPVRRRFTGVAGVWTVGAARHSWGGAERVVASLSLGAGGLPGLEPAVALDGKTLRGSRKPGAPGVHLLSAVAHQVGVTLAHQAVADKTHEITAVETVRSQLVLTGRVVMMDALLTPTAVAETIVEAGGDDVMVVKAHQPPLRAEMARIVAEPPVGDSQETADTLERGHGRLEQRRVTTSQALAG
jgi:hypothetical protein